MHLEMVAMTGLYAVAAAAAAHAAWQRRSRRQLARESGGDLLSLTRSTDVCARVVCWGVFGRKRRRWAVIERQLPDLLDWVALSVEAGQDLSHALASAADRLTPGPLCELFAQLQVDIRTGLSRREALQRMGDRSGTPSLAAFVALLVQVDAMGVGIAALFTQFSDRLRSSMLAKAERAGALASQRMIAPLILCILPANFVVILGPLVVRFLVEGPTAFF